MEYAEFMDSQIVYINGEYVSKKDAKISIFDLSVLRGFGVFDYLRTYKGRPFHFWEHLLRLKFSCEQMGMQLPKTLEEIETIVLHLLELNGHEESSVKIIATGGMSPDQFTPALESSLIILAYPLSSYPQTAYSRGIKVATSRLVRALPTSKTIQYAPAIVALQKVKNDNFQELLYLNEKGEMLEAATSNFFAFKEGILYTCDTDEVLVGITREVVLRLANGRFPIAMKALGLDDLPFIEEAFITASNKEVMPVVQIDQQIIGNGNVGPRTQEIMNSFREYTSQGRWPALSIERYRDPRATELSPASACAK